MGRRGASKGVGVVQLIGGLKGEYEKVGFELIKLLVMIVLVS